MRFAVRKQCLVVGVLAPVCLLSLLGQSAGTPGSSPSVVVHFQKLKPLASEATAAEPEAEPRPQRLPPGGYPFGTVVINNQGATALNPSPAGPLGALPSATNFRALNDNNTVIPPDTMGAVGPNHVMTILNSQVLIQDRNGGVISTVDLRTFWAPAGAGDPFDPHVAYDPYNGRWMACAAAGPDSSSALFVGVSHTNDPTGLWTMTRVVADVTGSTWADYPTLGFNKDWIVVTTNMFSTATGNSVRSNIWVFPKSDLYTAASTIRHTVIQDTSFGYAPAVTYDNTLSTMYLVQSWDGNIAGTGYVAINTITGPIGSETLNKSAPYRVYVTTPVPWADSAPSGAPQLGSGQGIDTDDDRITAAVYRNGYIWFAHTVFLPAGSPTRSSVQWWQVTPAGTIVQRALIDDPASNTFYAYPSIAVNKNNDALIGYTRFSPTQYASADYAFRWGTDPANAIESDVLYKAGEAAYFKTFSSSSNRWGDYSATVVDPIDDLKLWTLQEYAASSSGSFGRWGTWWTEIMTTGGAATPNSITATAGTPQSSTVGTAFATPLQAIVKDSGGNPLSAIPVTFTAPSSGASAAFGGSGAATATTNSGGVATAPALIANTQAGSYTVNASVSGVATPASFMLTNIAGAVTSIAATGGTPQTTTIGSSFASALQATVRDSGGNPVSGLSVTFTAPSAGASARFGSSNTATATTNASGIATAPALTANSQAGTYTIVATAPGAATSASFILTNSSVGLGFFPGPLCRIVDTRVSQGKTGPLGPPTLTAYSVREFPLLSSSCGLSNSARAYSLNFTVVPPGNFDFLAAWPAGQPYPGISTLNSGDGSIIANAAIVSAGTNGDISVVAGQATDLLIDSNGYFAPPNGNELVFYPVKPCRVADTRASQNKPGEFGTPALAAYKNRDFTIPSSSCNIPASAKAYALNLTVVPKGRLDFLSTWPAGQPYPGVSTLNSPDGSTIANAAIVPAGTNGAITVVAGNPTDFIMDISGYFAPPGGSGALHFYPLASCRVVDTRPSQGKTGAFGSPALAAYVQRDFPLLSSACAIPSAAQAYSLNITAVPTGHLDFLTVWPTGQPYPGVSTLNSPKGMNISNATIVPAGTNGSITVVAGNPTDVVIDINGYFAP